MVSMTNHLELKYEMAGWQLGVWNNTRTTFFFLVNILEQLRLFQRSEVHEGWTQTQYLNLISNSQSRMGLWDLRMSVGWEIVLVYLVNVGLQYLLVSDFLDSQTKSIVQGNGLVWNLYNIQPQPIKGGETRYQPKPRSAVWVNQTYSVEVVSPRSWFQYLPNQYGWFCFLFRSNTNQTNLCPPLR